MHQTGNMPSHRFARLAANNLPGSGPYNLAAGSNSTHSFPHHIHTPPSPGAYPYYPQYYGPSPPLIFPNPDSTEDIGSPGSTDELPSIHQVPAAPFQFGHQYHHHPVYPPQSQYYNQFYDRNCHLPAGQALTGDESTNDSSPERIGTKRSHEQLHKRMDEKSLPGHVDDRDSHSND